MACFRTEDDDTRGANFDLSFWLPVFFRRARAFFSRIALGYVSDMRVKNMIDDIPPCDTRQLQSQKFSLELTAIAITQKT